MLAEQQRSILDEHGVGIVGQLAQASNREACIGKRLFVCGMLLGCPFRRNRGAPEMRELALGEPRADRAGEGPHQRGSRDSLATILISVMPALGISRATSIAVQAGGGPTTYLFLTATIAGI